MRVVVTGAGGMLGRDVVTVFKERRHDVVALTRAGLDVTDRERVRQEIGRLGPELVVNCAAYTAVDAAEGDWEAALAVNGLGPRHLAAACRQMGAVLLHISTDYVFDGGKEGPHGVYDPTGPVNAYGRTKLWGERAIRDVCPAHYIVRTSWLFGDGPNFVRTMLALGRERESLRVVDDQHGAPTFTVDLARALAVALPPAG